MADVHETCQSNGNNINEVSSKKKGNRSKQELDLDNTARGMSTTQSTSRFHVARVNDEKKTEDSEQPLSEEPKPTPASGKPAKQLDFQIPESPQSPKSPYDSVQFFAGTVSPNDTYGYNNSCETHMKTFGKNTVEAIPHVDHYRNLLSATAALKSRPTLAELHEEKVIWLLWMLIGFYDILICFLGHVCTKYGTIQNARCISGPFMSGIISGESVLNIYSIHHILDYVNFLETKCLRDFHRL